MALTALDGTPLVQIGGQGRSGGFGTANFGSDVTDAALEAVIFVGHVFTEDGGTHTINTTGSSSLGWKTGTTTFANGATTVTVGLAAVDMTAGPPARAVNVANAITFDVGVTFTGGGGGITTVAWQTSVPTSGSKTIANGDLVAFAVQMVTRGGADSVSVQTAASTAATNLPVVTGYAGGTYTSAASQPNVVITFSDGTLGTFVHSAVAVTLNNSTTLNSGGAIIEAGNFYQMPVPVNIYGFVLQLDYDNDCDMVLYSDPLGTPVAQKTVSLDLNVRAATTAGITHVLFPVPYTTTANQPLAAVAKPGAANVALNYLTLASANHQKAWQLGTNCYAVSRAAAGAFAAQNSSMDRYAGGLLVGAFDNGAGAGGGGGGSVFGSKGGVIT